MADFPKSIGGLWLSSNEKIFASGEVTVNGVTEKIVVFKNDRKTEDKYPDYRIFKKQPKEEKKEEKKPDETGDIEPF